MTFGHVGKRLDWKDKINFMTSQSGQQTITIHILPNISRSKGNLTMKLGQLIEYNKIFFFKIYTEDKSGRQVRDLILFFKKA